ncbi:sulfurtransferase TusA family protein [Qingshengfaniella alkalisoli]|uniref:Sulfurtransferase TusA family protein n=1 Tax=Qingshengfaniella alkalisoli TaxID=2599296 RepID=A0A5B8IU73_9RHOB|nr:sulfurtransferase TusA family protein [Qingshengfaniella alkalisoli]QDY69184.1 sulfurtransferase TusA family protein [Qingshengfaniella alkalisoli]
MNAEFEIDAVGLLCPLPVLKLRKRLQSVPVGTTLCLISDDPAAIIDVPHFCAESGNELAAQESSGAAQRFFVTKR